MDPLSALVGEAPGLQLFDHVLWQSTDHARGVQPSLVLV